MSLDSWQRIRARRLLGKRHVRQHLNRRHAHPRIFDQRGGHIIRYLRAHTFDTIDMVTRGKSRFSHAEKDQDLSEHVRFQVQESHNRVSSYPIVSLFYHNTFLVSPAQYKCRSPGWEARVV